MLIALRLNQMPTCKNWLILLLQKIVSNQTPVGASRPYKLLAVRGGDHPHGVGAYDCLYAIVL